MDKVEQHSDLSKQLFEEPLRPLTEIRKEYLNRGTIIDISTLLKYKSIIDNDAIQKTITEAEKVEKTDKALQ